MISARKVLTMILLVGGGAAVAHWGTSQIRSADEDWHIQQQHDKMTDTTTMGAYKLYHPENGGKIEASAHCNADGLQFEFDYFAKDDDGTGKDKESSYDIQHSENVVPVFSSGGDYRTVVANDSFAIQYRLDNQPAQSQTVNPKFINQAILNFWHSYAKDVVQANLMRVRLPLIHGESTDIEIKLTALHDLFTSCPASAFINPGMPLGSDYTQSAVQAGNATQATEQTNSTPQSASDSGVKPDAEWGTAEWAAKNPDKLAHSEMFNATPSTPKSPAINCNSPRKSTLDVLICSNAQLLSSDGQLNAAYQRLKQSLNTSDKELLKANQKEWLASRPEKCGLATGDISQQEGERIISCLQGLYDQRVSTLQSQLQKSQ